MKVYIHLTGAGDYYGPWFEDVFGSLEQAKEAVLERNNFLLRHKLKAADPNWVQDKDGGWEWDDNLILEREVTLDG